MIGAIQRLSQTITACVYNSYVYGFFAGIIYQGRFKILPCPGFNCHSCPAALCTCPIGAIQLFASYGVFHISLYVFGFLAIIGSIGGRIICGWACPFGLLQDLLHKIPGPKWRIPAKLEHSRYLILLLFVFIATWDIQDPLFCKLFCPTGTLEAGIPLLLLNADLRELASTVFLIKTVVLLLFLLWMVVSARPFCRVFCPLGAIYSLFNHFSLVRLRVDLKRCTHCKVCQQVCPTEVELDVVGGGSSRCVRCFRCVSACPTGAISVTTSFNPETYDRISPAAEAEGVAPPQDG